MLGGSRPEVATSCHERDCQQHFGRCYCLDLDSLRERKTTIDGSAPVVVQKSGGHLAGLVYDGTRILAAGQAAEVAGGDGGDAVDFRPIAVQDVDLQHGCRSSLHEGHVPCHNVVWLAKA